MTSTEESRSTAEIAAERDAREQIIHGLHQLARLLENNPDLPCPYNVAITEYVSAAEARAGRRGIAGWEKRNSKTASWVDYSLQLSDREAWQRGAVTYSLEVSKQETCQQVQVGVKHVEEQPAVPARDIPVMEWRCSSGPGNDDDDR